MRSHGGRNSRRTMVKRTNVTPTQAGRGAAIAARRGPGEVVHLRRGAAPERGGKNPADVGEGDAAIHRAARREEGRREALSAERADEGGGAEALAQKRPAARAGHVRRGPSLVEGHGARRALLWREVCPLGAGLLRRAYLLRRPEPLFLSFRPIRASAVRAGPTPAGTPRPRESQARGSVGAGVVRSVRLRPPPRPPAEAGGLRTTFRGAVPDHDPTPDHRKRIQAS